MTGNDPQANRFVNGYRGRLSDGRRAMAHLIHVWHERNGWSHKVLPALAECLDLGRLHNSQISNLRNGKLASPGPEVFLALSQANAILHEGIEPIEARLKEVHPELLKVLSDSCLSLEGQGGKPLGAGEFFEIFLGLAPIPECFDWFIEEEEAADLSAALADCFCAGRSWRQCGDRVLTAYPVSNSVRRERFCEVMAGIRDYTAEELDGELLDLCSALRNLGGFDVRGTKDFLEILRSRAEVLKQG